jgi:metal-sulfur cluster biosynthetic enzyme
MAEQDPIDGGDPTVGESGPTYCAYTDYSQDTPSETSLPATGEGASGIERRVWDALYGIDDPEMPVSIVDLGLIYGVRVVREDTTGDAADTGRRGTPDTRVAIDMTLTYTGCPARGMLLEEVEEEVRSVEGVSEVALELVWSPNWSLEMLTEQGRADLREFGLSVPDANGEEA